MCRDTFTHTMAPVLRPTLQTLLAKAEVGRGFRVMNTAVITTRSPCTMSRGLLERHAHPTSLCTTLLTNCSLYTQADTKLQLHVRLYIYMVQADKELQLHFWLYPTHHNLLINNARRANITNYYLSHEQAAIYIWRYHNVDKLQPEVTSGILSCHAIKRYIARLTDGPSCQRTWGSDTGCIPARGVSFRLSLTLYSRRRVTLRFSLPLQVTSYGHEGMYGVYTRCNAIQTNSSEAV
jgi:hypothetical protein